MSTRARPAVTSHEVESLHSQDALSVDYTVKTHYRPSGNSFSCSVVARFYCMRFVRSAASHCAARDAVGGLLKTLDMSWHPIQVLLCAWSHVRMRSTSDEERGQMLHNVAACSLSALGMVDQINVRREHAARK